jgi:hypothetical protein
MKRVAYLGDTALPGPASYLAGILTHFGIPFLHVPSDETPPEAAFVEQVGLYVLSDYPSANFETGAMETLCRRVDAGAGLLMLGGWESYHGLGGDYDATPLARRLPVVMETSDDRCNAAQGVAVRRVADHPVLDGLPFETPPCIGGYNRFAAAPEAKTILEGEILHLAVGEHDGALRCTPGERFPLLTVSKGNAGPAGSGRRACLATDVAPHWVGGFVDWGAPRLTVAMENDSIEVGCRYAAFFRNLVRWTLGEAAS